MVKSARFGTISSMAVEGDYVLGTHDEELRRLGLQHRIWRPVVLDCWQKAGLTIGKRVLDVGAGPGYAAVDLAEIVGPTGEVVALERSPNFVAALRHTCHERGLTNLQVHEIDLMVDQLPGGGYDFSWCRWVACFVSDPALLLGKLSKVIRRGGRAIFHEYADYDSWRFLPRLQHQEEFRRHVVDTWRESGGEPDAAPILAGLFREHGFVIRSATPHIFAIRPTDYFWRWPGTFIEGYLPRLQEMGRITPEFSDAFRAELARIEKDPNALMITPLVLELVAEKIE